jgi:hypothetical protein
MNADQLHKNEAAAMGLPNSAPTTKTPAPNINAKPVEDPEAPIPVSKSQQLNPVRPPIANPFDILNR